MSDNIITWPTIDELPRNENGLIIIPKGYPDWYDAEQYNLNVLDTLLSNKANTYTSPAQLGFSNSDFSEINLDTNIAMILERMQQGERVFTFVNAASTNFPELAKSVQMYFGISVDVLGVEIIRSNGINSPSPIYIYPNGTGAKAMPIYHTTYDNILAPPRTLVFQEDIDAALSNKADIGPPIILELTLNKPFTVDDNFTPYYWRSQENIVTVTAKMSTTETPSTGTTFATLPEGYRPWRRTVGVVAFRNVGSNSTEGSGHIIVDTNGNIALHSSDLSGSSQHSISFNLSFVCYVP